MPTAEKKKSIDVEKPEVLLKRLYLEFSNTESCSTRDGRVVDAIDEQVFVAPGRNGKTWLKFVASTPGGDTLNHSLTAYPSEEKAQNSVHEMEISDLFKINFQWMGKDFHASSLTIESKENLGYSFWPHAELLNHIFGRLIEKMKEAGFSV